MSPKILMLHSEIGSPRFWLKEVIKQKSRIRLWWKKKDLQYNVHPNLRKSTEEYQSAYNLSTNWPPERPTMMNSKYVGKASTRRPRSEATSTKVTSQSKKLVIKPEEQFKDLFEKYMTRHAPQPHRLGFRDFCRHPGVPARIQDA